MDIREMAHGLQPELLVLRRDFHAHPELGLEEFRTTGKIADVMEKLQIPYRLTEPTGLIADLRGTRGESGRCVLLRADIDALPVQEETGLPFASERPGVMHACGHDTHAAMLLGAASILSRLRDRFAGTVRFVFQPAEEIGKGADLMIDQGAADDADMGMAIHIFGTYGAHQVDITPGPAAAATDFFTIELTGKSCHGAHPHAGVDATYAAASVLVQLQTMVSREFPPADPVVVTVGSLHSGTKNNIVSGRAVMEGSCRSFSREVWERIPAVLERIVTETAAALRCEAKVTFDRLTRPLICDEEACRILREAVNRVLPGGGLWRADGASPGGEDFAAFGERIPIAWLKLGGASPYPQHSGKVCFDESVLEDGAAYYAQFAVDALEALRRQS